MESPVISDATDVNIFSCRWTACPLAEGGSRAAAAGLRLRDRPEQLLEAEAAARERDLILSL